MINRQATRVGISDFGIFMGLGRVWLDEKLVVKVKGRSGMCFIEL